MEAPEGQKEKSQVNVEEIMKKSPKFDENIDLHIQKFQITQSRINANPTLDTSWLSSLKLTSENLEKK